MADQVNCGAPHPTYAFLGNACERPKGHDGMHRYRNYVWLDGDKGADYVPVPIRRVATSSQPPTKQEPPRDE